jgi:hypothetical protein
MKKMYALGAPSLVLVLALAVTVTSPVFAEESTDETTTTTNSDSTTETKRKEQLKQKAQAAREKAKQRVEKVKENAKQKLETARKSTCEKHEAKINNILQRAAAHGDKKLGVFQKIEDRVKQFKEDKQYTVENYDAVVAAVDEKEAAAVEAVEATGATTFECDSESTDKSFSGLVKSAVSEQRTALHEYRKAINDLIHAVKKGTKPEKTETTESTENESGTETENETDNGTETEPTGEGQ